MGLKFIASASEFQSAIGLLARFANKYGHAAGIVRIDATKSNVRVSSSIAGGWASVSMDCVDVQRTGVVYLNVKSLAAASASDDTVLVDADGESIRVCASTRESTLTNSPVDCEWMPTTTAGSGEFSASPAWLREAFSDAELHRATETSRYAISGALVKCAGGVLSVVATDGRRLFLATTKNAGEFNAILSGEAMKVFAWMKDADGPALVTLDKGTVFIGCKWRTMLVTLASPVVDGTFPPYEDIISGVKKDNAARIDLDAKETLAACKESQKFTSEECRGTSWVYETGSVTIATHCQTTGESSRRVDAKASGVEPWQRIGLNPWFAADAIKVCRSQSVAMTMCNAKKPVGVFAGDRFVVVMPVTLADVEPPKKPAKAKPTTKAATPTPAPFVTPNPTKEPAPMPKPTAKPPLAPESKPVTPAPTDQAELSAHARALIDALAKIGTPAVKKTMLSTAGIPASAWSDALSEAYRARKITRDRTRTDNVYHVLAK